MTEPAPTESSADGQLTVAQPLEPLDANEVVIVGVGMALWAIALILLATVFRHDLERHHATWWYWACGLGLLLGVYGLRFARRRRRRG